MSQANPGLLQMFLAYCVPLLIAALCLFSIWRVRRKQVRIVLGVVALLIGLPGAWLAAEVGSYCWALHLESKWSPARPKTRAEMESYLSLYRTRVIQPKDSMWGNRYVLKDGERMLQYMILWDAPLDVVYDKDDRVVVIFTSYE